MPHLFYLVGPPAVGKLTVARELERRTGAIVVDNHLVNDPVFVPMGVHRGEGIDATDELRRRVLSVVHEAAELAPASFSHVFTNWLPDEPENAALVGRLRDLARRRGARFVPVWLTADAEALAARVVAPERTQRAKLMDPELLRTLVPIPELPAPSDAVVIDTTHIGPVEVADRILGSL
jgi:gluconate kinase